MADEKDILDERSVLDIDLREGLDVEKESVESGSVFVSKRVFEERIREDVPVTEEEVAVERREINEYVDVAPPPVRQEGNVTIVSVVKEVLVVEKRLMLVEELHITKNKKETIVPVDELVRKEEVSISQTNIGTNFEPLW